jgi:PAS domain S-box-containing protein
MQSKYHNIAMYRILYVDDEPDLLEIGKRFLEESGEFTVTTALSAPEAIRVLEQEKFDAIISGYQMPGMDGIQFLVEVRTRFGSIPFILFTGRGREEVVIQAINSGADFYLQKGGEPESQFAELSHKIKQAASRKRADDALKRSEEKYRHLIEHSDEAIVVAQDGMLKLVNHRTVELTGYSEQELLSMQFSAFVHPDDRAMVMKRYQKQLKGEELPSRYAFRLSPNDASTIWVEISVVSIDWDGRPATLNFLTDITERKRADDELRKAHDELENRVQQRTVELSRAFETLKIEHQHLYDVLETLPVYICLLTPDYHMPFANKYFRETFGESKGRRCYEFLFNRTEPCEICEMYTVIKTRAPHHWYWTGPNGRDYDIYDLPFIETDGSLNILEMGLDITEHKRAEEAIKRAGAYNRNLIETSLDPLVTINPDGTISDVNAATVAVTGFSRKELIGTDFSRYFTEPDRAKTGYETVFRDGAVTDYALEIQHRDGHTTPVLYNATVFLDELGNIAGVFAAARDITERKKVGAALQKAHDELEERVQQRTAELAKTNIRLESEVDERKKAEAALRETNEYLHKLIDFANAPIIVWNPDFRITRFNHAFEHLTGRVEQEVIEQPLDILFPKKSRDTSLALIKKTLTGEQWETVEIPILASDGTIHTVLWNTANILTAEAELISTIAQGVDITERKRVEDALKKSEALLKRTGEIARVGGWEMDAETLAVTWTEETFHIHEVPVGLMPPLEEAINFFHPDERRKLSDAIQRALTTGEGYDMELRFITAKGKQLWTRTICQPQVVDGKTIRLIGTFQDINERKRAEEALRESEETFKALAENANDGIIVAVIEGAHTYANRRASEITGYSIAELLKTSIKDLAAPDEVKNLIERFRKRLSGEDVSQQYETLIIRKDGKSVSIELTGAKTFWHGQPADLVIIRDITERKRAEEQIRWLASFPELNPNPVIEMDAQGTITFANAATLKTLRNLGLPENPALFVPENKEDILRLLRETGELQVYRELFLNNETFAEDITLNHELRVVRIYTKNITNRKRAEEALRESEEHLKEAQRVGHLGSWDLNVVTGDLQWSDECYRIYGFRPQEFVPTYEKFRSIVHPEDLGFAQEQVDAALNNDKHYDVDFRFVRPNGEIGWIHCEGEVTRDAEGKPIRFFGTQIDITERKRAEVALREANEYLNNLFDYANALIIVWDPEYVITRFNHAFEDLTLRSEQEVIGQRLDILFPKESRDTSLLQIKKTLEGERWEIVEIPILVNDGSVRTVLWNSANILDTDGRIISTIAQGVDITERKHAEDGLRQVSKKLTLLTSITRHDISNQILTLNGFIALLQRKVPDPAFEDFFKRITNASARISAMIQFTKEYEKIGVKAPVWQDCRTLVDTAAKQTPLGQVMVKNDLPAGTEVFADPLVVKVCYNLMDNAVRYGGKITTIRFSVQESGDDHLIVCEDDGDGVVAGDKEMIFERGFGKNTGLGLALSREILTITGITIRETGKPGNGARFEMTVPKGAYRFGVQ